MHALVQDSLLVVIQYSVFFEPEALQRPQALFPSSDRQALARMKSFCPCSCKLCLERTVDNPTSLLKSAACQGGVPG